MMIIEMPRLVVVLGPTAIGKTGIAIQLARHFQTEILSADSRQFFREMKIGTAAPSTEELNAAPHHFIGHLSIHDPYNVSRFETDALKKLTTLFTRHNLVLLTGGSGLYINAVCHGIDPLPDPDPELRKQLKDMLQNSGIGALQNQLQSLDPDYFLQMDQNNPVRLIRALEVTLATGMPYSSLRTQVPKPRPFTIIKIGLYLPRPVLNERIDHRVDRMMEAGLLREAESLYPHRHLNALNSVGYKELFDYFEGKHSIETAVEKIKTNTRRYAKRQMTWFRKDPSIAWYTPDQLPEILLNLI